MIKNILFLFISFLLTVNIARSQTDIRIGEWRIESSKLLVRDMASFGENIYAATTGGLIVYSPEKTETITILDGLSSLDINSMVIDRRGTIILGMNSPIGNFDFYSPDDGFTYTINENLSGITSLAVSGDSVFAGFFAADQIGLLLLTYDNASGRYNFKDSFKNFPAGLSFSEITAISIIEDSIYVGTDGGLISASVRGDNLKDPSNWTELKLNTGGVERIRAISLVGGVLTVAPDRGLYRRETGNWVIEDSLFTSSLVVNSIFESPAGFFLASNRGIYERREGIGWRRLTIESRPTKALTESSDGTLWVGFLIEGVARLDESLSRFVSEALNSPFSNTITSMSMGVDSVLWTGSNKGFNSFSDRGWKGFLSSRDGNSHLNFYSDIDRQLYLADTLLVPLSTVEITFAASNGLLYFGYGGSGMLEYDPNSPEDFIVFDTTNGILAGSEGHGGTSGFVVLDDIAEDVDGNLWLANAFAETDRHLIAFDPDRNFHYFRTNSGLLNGVLRAISIDSKGLIWLGFQADSETFLPQGGLQVLDYAGTLADQSDDSWFNITKTDGLESNIVNDIVVDKDDVVWIAVVGGVHRLVIPFELSKANLRASLSSIIPIVSDHNVQRIEVDNRNNKWFATETGGVKVLLTDNTWLNGNEGFTTNNSPLLSDNVTSIEFDPSNGDVFIATLKGISILRTQFADPLESLASVRTYPSPFIIPASNDMVIDNLADGASIKILDINGDLIRELTAGTGEIKGRQGFWDGRDDNNRLVASGIYLAFVFTNTELKATTKIAVVRR